MAQESDKYLVRVRIERLPEGVWLATSDDLPGLVVEAPTRKELIDTVPKVAHELIMSYFEHGDTPPPELQRRAAATASEIEVSVSV